MSKTKERKAKDSHRQKLLSLIRSKNKTLKDASFAIGKNHAYIHQYLFRGMPSFLGEPERKGLARFLGIKESEVMEPDNPAAFDHDTAPVENDSGSDTPAPPPPVQRQPAVASLASDTAPAGDLVDVPFLGISIHPLDLASEASPHRARTVRGTVQIAQHFAQSGVRAAAYAGPPSPPGIPLGALVLIGGGTVRAGALVAITTDGSQDTDGTLVAIGLLRDLRRDHLVVSVGPVPEDVALERHGLTIDHVQAVLMP